ncbi:MAG: rhamnogalacturonan acetylesterase [Bryobacteraceae bacterium]
MRSSILCFASLFCTAFAGQHCSAGTLPPIRIILVGDSTMAVGSGYGPGFCAQVKDEATCLNMAKGGRSTKSYREEGSWAEVTETLHQIAPYTATYVLIQFGHNDQPNKPGRSTDLATEFPANMRTYVQEVRAAGAKPVLVTPLTRRMFRDGKLEDTLGPWAEATRKVAAAESVPLLDLYRDSSAAIQKLGPTEANTLAMATAPPAFAESARAGTSRPLAPKQPSSTRAESQGDPGPVFDYTHLGSKGSLYFGRMVAAELISTVPELQPYFKQQ